MNWIKAGVEAPRDGKHVVGWLPNTGEMVKVFCHDGLWYTAEVFPRAVTVSHWRGMLKPPREHKLTQAMRLMEKLGVERFTDNVNGKLNEMGFYWSEDHSYWYHKG